MGRYQLAEDGRVVEDTITGELQRYKSVELAMAACEMKNLEWENQLMKGAGLV